jgi:uncharacterized protein YndB with AHSA1/START domain
VQQLRLTVDVPPAKVWAALTTDAGVQGWVAPVAHVTPGNNGMLEASYLGSSKIGDPDNIRNRIIVYLPDKLLVFHNEHAPKNGPFKPEAIDKIRTMVELQDLGGGRTQIVESGVGYLDGPDFDSMYAHFRDGNAEEFASLANALAGHPIDWKAEAAKMEASVRKPAAKATQ